MFKASEDELKDALRWVDKEKVSDWLLRLPYEEERTARNPKHLMVAKVLENHINPKPFEEYFAEKVDFSSAPTSIEEQEESISQCYFSCKGTKNFRTKTLSTLFCSRR